MGLKTCQRFLCQSLHPEVYEQERQLAENMIHATATFTASERIEVYRHSVTGLKQRVLHTVYPVCLQILGEDYFDQLLKNYVWSNELDVDDLNTYGSDFAGWLDQQVAIHTELADFAYLPDLARLEWYWQASLLSQDDPAFDFDRFNLLHAQYGEKLVPVLSHSLQLLASTWPVYEIWQSHRKNLPSQHYDMPEEIQYYVLFRANNIQLIKINKATFQFLYLCKTEIDLEQIGFIMQDTARECFANLTSYIETGWITGFDTVDNIHELNRDV